MASAQINLGPAEYVYVVRNKNKKTRAKSVIVVYRVHTNTKSIKIAMLNNQHGIYFSSVAFEVFVGDVLERKEGLNCFDDDRTGYVSPWKVYVAVGNEVLRASLIKLGGLDSGQVVIELYSELETSASSKRVKSRP